MNEPGSFIVSMFSLLFLVMCMPGIKAVQRAGGLTAHRFLLVRVSFGAWLLFIGFIFLLGTHWGVQQHRAWLDWLSKAGNGWTFAVMAAQWLLLNAMFVVPLYGLFYKGSIEDQARSQGFFRGLLAAARKARPQKEAEGYVAIGRFQANGTTVYLGSDRKMHTHIIGATGVGKTEAIKKLIENDIRADYPVVWIDGKGDLSNAAWFASQVARCGKEHRARFYLPGKKFGSYNALRHGNATELADRVVSCLDWSEQYYKNAAKDFLLGVFRALLSKKEREFSLVDVYQATNSQKALQRLIAESEDPQAKEILSNYASNKDKQQVLHGLSAQLSVLVNSSFGDMLLGGTNDIDFREVYQKSLFVYIALPVTSAEEFFPSVGKLMIADINALNSTIANGQLKRYSGIFSLVIDEFSSFVTPQFVKLLSQARSQNFAITIAHQTLADLAKLDVETQNAIMGNTNIKMAMQLDVPDDAEIFAKMVGTRKALEQTHQTQSGVFGDGFSGAGSMKVVDEYVIHPNEIKRLQQGQAAFIRKRPLAYGLIDITRAWHAETEAVALEALRSMLWDRKREGAALAWGLSPRASQAKLAANDEPATRSVHAVASTVTPAMSLNAKSLAKDDDSKW